MSTHDDSERDPRAELAELEARQRRFEEIQAQAKQQLDQIRNDPRVQQSLDDYAKEYGDGDPSWWKPEYELADSAESERVEHVVASVPQRIRDLSHSIASVIVDNTAEELERLSTETGITVAELRSMDDLSAPEKAHVALRLAHQIHAISYACGEYGLARDEFEALPAGPTDRTAGTLVGRQPRSEAKKLHEAKRGITGTAQLAVPDEVRAAGPAAPESEPTPLPPMKRQLRARMWGGLIGAAALIVIVYVVMAQTGTDEQDEHSRSGLTAPSAPSASAPAPHPSASQHPITTSAAVPSPASASAPEPSAPEPPRSSKAPVPRPVPSPPVQPAISASATSPKPASPKPTAPKPTGSGLIFRPE